MFLCTCCLWLRPSMTASLLQLLHVCKELNVCVQYEQPVGTLPVSVVLQGRNCGMCLRSSTEVSLITFIVPLILIHQAHKVDCCSSYVCSLNRFIWLQDFPSHKWYFIILCFLPYARHKWLGVADSGQLPPNSFEHAGHECRVMLQSDCRAEHSNNRAGSRVVSALSISQ